MTKRIGSSRRKTRDYMTRPASERGKFPLRGLTQQFAAGDCVVLKAEPSVHKGLYFRRFHGKTAKVTVKRGMCYEVSVRDGGKVKTLIVNPVHMVRV